MAGALALLGLTACTQAETAIPAAGPAEAQTAEDLVAQGQYMVAMGGCNDCHTAMTPTGPDMSHALQGAALGFAPLVEMPWAPNAPPIAGLPEGWTGDDMITFLTGGGRPSGVPVLPPMPQYRASAADAAAMTAYIASLPKAE
ncbi:hypothetical protein HJO_10514 [Hyphomonas johnsonii MHS-2]|uniref:Cytochrome c domain-containing protein n=1 Tax=Hyphomonas johnsonii MHS-2 TaxID=1280950 RepID=A0A059FPB7_9PROT|nr:hypothetical protein HJO_10514 [Hyphomonas johnsonii MHS-2]